MAVTGTETYTTVYTYDANNRLLTETKTENNEAVTTTYTYDANGNTLSKSTPAHGEDEASSTTYTYNGFNQLIALTVDGTDVAYAYNAQGIRTAKRVNNLRTAYLLDGGNVVAEIQSNTVTDNYLRGVNLICRTSSSETEYYLFNAHGDVVTTTNLNGTINQSYDYDAFGNEKNPDNLDTNPFRYCGEYLDFETGSYYLRARYYDPSIGRFTQQDTHWNTANMIYGDNPQKINEREDKLGLKTYSYAPQITAVMQSENLFVYCGNNPLYYSDPTGREWYHWVIGGIIVAAAAAVVITAGGIVPAMYAVSAVACGTAATTATSTIAAGAFIGSAIVVGSSLFMADYSSIESFNASANWSTVAFTAGGLLVGSSYGYTLYQNNQITIAGKGSTGRTEASNLNEQIAMKKVMSNPLSGAKELTNVKMNDTRWLSSDGWVKMEVKIKLSDGSNIIIHFVYNTITKVFDDFKFKS